MGNCRMRPAHRTYMAINKPAMKVFLVWLTITVYYRKIYGLLSDPLCTCWQYSGPSNPALCLNICITRTRLFCEVPSAARLVQFGLDEDWVPLIRRRQVWIFLCAFPTNVPRTLMCRPFTGDFTTDLVWFWNLAAYAHSETS